MIKRIREILLKNSDKVILMLNILLVWNAMSFLYIGMYEGIVADLFIAAYVNIGLKLRAESARPRLNRFWSN